MRCLVWAKPEFIYMLLCYHCFTHSLLVIFPECKLNSVKNKPWKCYHIGHTKGGFSGLRRLSDSQIIPLQIPITLYQTRKNGVIGEEQYQINNPTKPILFLYKYWTAKKVGNNATFTTGLPTKTTFDGCMTK